MNISIGTKIRALRKERNISQEVLAQALCVSVQAVSKWETQTTLPDITLVPAIAAFFKVSTDDLFDYDRLRHEQLVMDVVWKAAACRDDRPEEAESILRDGLRQFPGNDILLNNLLYTMRSPDRAEEVIALCQTLIASTEDDEVRLDALRILAETYHEQGQQELCVNTLEKLPEIYFTKLERVAQLTEGETSLDAARKQMGLSSDQTIDMLLIMQDRLNGLGRCDEAAKYGRIARGVIEAFQKEEGERFQGDWYRFMREKLTEIRQKD